MNIPGNVKWQVIFFVIVGISALSALLANETTGMMGIEDRFQQAVGLAADEEELEDGESGIFIEGNPLLYLVVVSLLIIVCIVLYVVLITDKVHPVTK